MKKHRMCGATPASPLGTQRAFTLLELLICCAIIALLAMGSTALLAIVNTNKANIAARQLMHFIQATRQIAMSFSKPVIVCPTTDHTTCEKQWTGDAIAFLDSNDNGSLGEDEVVLIYYFVSDQDIRLDWRAFGNKTNIAFTREGFTAHQNGRFYVCLSKGDSVEERQILLHKSGRARLAAPAELKKSKCL